MFRFDFALNNDDADAVHNPDVTQADREPILGSTGASLLKSSSSSTRHFQEHLLDDLLEELPPSISYSFVTIPTAASSSPSISLLRRELFDARFQLIASQGAEMDQGQDDEGDMRMDGDQAASTRQDIDSGYSKASEFIENPSDLIRGEYEGGLKTWEASLDLVRVLDEMLSSEGSSSLEGRSVLEVGCGSALPSCYLLGNLFDKRSTGHPNEERTIFHLQDFNKEVLLLVTLPNILLSFFHAQSQSFASDGVGESHQPEEGGELELSEDFIECFKSHLRDRNIEIRLFSGEWEGFNPAPSLTSSISQPPSTPHPPYNLILTSETIYELDSLPSLTRLLSSFSFPSLPPSPPYHSPSLANIARGQSLTLVACKRVYFGVGGGELAFIDLWESRRGVGGGKGVKERKGWTRKVYETGEATGDGRDKGRESGVERVCLAAGWMG